VQNYFNYFTEIEEHFQRRRGTTLLLSTLDWALIETWKDAGIPLEAVMRGIDAAFDAYERRPSKTRKVNSLAYCAQEVLAAAEDMREAATGARPPSRPAPPGLEPKDIAGFLLKNARLLEAAETEFSPMRRAAARDCAQTLRELATAVREGRAGRLEEVERHLAVLEEKLFAALLAATPDSELLQARAQADRAIAAYRGKMPASQIGNYTGSSSISGCSTASSSRG